MNKAQSLNFNLSGIHFCFTFFPYQVSLGMSLGYFEGIRFRLYVLCFKLSIDTSYMKKDLRTPEKKPSVHEIYIRCQNNHGLSYKEELIKYGHIIKKSNFTNKSE